MGHRQFHPVLICEVQYSPFSCTLRTYRHRRSKPSLNAPDELMRHIECGWVLFRLHILCRPGQSTMFNLHFTWTRLVESLQSMLLLSHG